MMLSASPSTIIRSSLEEMLDSLKRRDENEKAKDLPPALPARPNSKGRLPPARRSLPVNFKVGDEGIPECSVSGFREKEETKRKEKDLESKVGSFGSKRLKKDQNNESPYVLALENCRSYHMEESYGAASSPKKVGDSDWDDNVSYFIKKKLHVWCHLPHGKWELGTIQSSAGEEAVVLLSKGNVMKVSTAQLLPANPDLLEGVDDLIQLSYLNEPSVLYNLRQRFSQNKIYSKAGPVMIAINPFKDVGCYGNDVAMAYRKKLMDSPHIYATADAAYNEMLTDGINQSIIISGESGAGKTETAKVAMQYLASLGGGSLGVENGILQTNYILEAFGNAKTSRNDNSSRFGKLIEIHFSTPGKICGAKIQTFLLEKSRVVHLAQGERSYHIFYQICAGASPSLKGTLKLKEASEYKYLNQSECLRIDGVDDAQKFNILKEALDTVKICSEDQEQAFSMLAAVLWLGNISFQAIDSENQMEVLADEALANAAKLMGCSSQELMLVLSTQNIQAGRDSIAKKLTLQQAIDTRDALAKFIYSSLFEWLVEQINKFLAVGKRGTERSISILDICGFESFKKNSFEQFCINYANERLQQHFIRHVFKLEQEDYEGDGIDWTKVDFEDNQECLNLIEKKPLGILALLDEESKFPKATDLTFANKLKHHLNVNSCFKGERGRAFGVHHYAGEVVYDTNGFLEKNRDPLPTESIQFIASCSYKLPQLFASKLLSHKAASSQGRMGTLESPKLSVGTKLSPKLSVGTKFKDQLYKLMHHLENTSPHFIRCIKPNSNQASGSYEEDLVLQQLRCCGVLEVVRIARSGYPTRIPHQEFAWRYGFLLRETGISQDPLSISVAVLQQFNILPEMYQVGYTKLFLRTGQIGALEERRKQVLNGIVGVQKSFRGLLARRHFRDLKNEAMMLQSFVRGENVRREYVTLKSSTNSVTRTNNELQAIIQLQSMIRGWLARRCCNRMQDLNKLRSESVKSKLKQGRKISEVKVMPQEQLDVLPTVLSELQMRVLKAESALEKKEEENDALRDQVLQYEVRWSEYEAKMKSMEETWQKQMTSFQMSLVAARKSSTTDQTPVQPIKIEAMSPSRYYDSEDTTSVGSRTPGASTPIKYSTIPEIGTLRDTHGTLAAVSNLAKEFEQQSHTFDEDAQALVQVKTSQFETNWQPYAELRKLKKQFKTWKKDYKARLREAKVKLQKLGHVDAEKSRRKWWGKLR